MSFKKSLKGRGKVVAAGLAAVAVAAGATTGTAVAAKQITSSQIKNGTIQTRDLTKNNFARFTATETVVSAVTPVNALQNNRQVVGVPAGNQPTPLTQIVLNRGTYKISGTAQFYSDNDNESYGQVTVSGLTGSFNVFYTGDIPDGNGPNGAGPNNGNAAQTSFSGTVTITADNTPVVVYGTISGQNGGQAGAEISANQYKYVKLFKGGNPK